MTQIATMIDLVYRVGPAAGPEKWRDMIEEWTDSLTLEDALTLVEYVETGGTQPCRIHVPLEWLSEVCDSACYYAGKVENRLRSGIIRVRLEQLLTDEQHRYSALLGLEQVASPESVPALVGHLGDKSFPVVDELARTLAAIRTPEALTHLHEMLTFHQHDPKKASSIKSSLKEAEMLLP